MTQIDIAQLRLAIRNRDSIILDCLKEELTKCGKWNNKTPYVTNHTNQSKGSNRN